MYAVIPMALNDNFIYAPPQEDLVIVYEDDDLVVIENGRVMETGTHEELYANHGKYYEIFNAMSDSLNLDKISQTLNS